MTEDKLKNPYKGLWVMVLLMLGFPLFIFGVMYAVFTTHQAHFGADMCFWTAFAVAGIVGSLFCTILVIAGVFKESFLVMADRIKELFDDFKVSFFMAFKWYWYRVKTEGVVFLILFFLYLINIFVAVFGSYKYIVLFT